MADEVSMLFDDYAARFARGERPDARDYLRRAGEGADELAGMMDAFLARAQPPAPDEESRAVAAAWVAGEPPLLELRTRRGLRRDEVVDALVRALGLDPAKREKVKQRYHELETGVLDARRVDDRVWDALSAALRAPVGALRAWRPRPRGPEPVYLRASEPLASAPMRMHVRARAEEPDEIDRLFGCL